MANLDDVQADGLRATFGVNSVGTFQMSRAAAKYMNAGRAIVNVSSIAGQTGTGSSFAHVL